MVCELTVKDRKSETSRKEILKRYFEETGRHYKGISALSFKDSDMKESSGIGIISGINFFEKILIGNILNENKEFEGVRIPSLTELENLLEDGDFRNRCDSLVGRRDYIIDVGCVLRTKDNPNRYFSEDLFKQLEKAKEKSDYRFRLPAVIPFSSMELVEDKKSPEGFSFRLNNYKEISGSGNLNDAPNGAIGSGGFELALSTGLCRVGLGKDDGSFPHVSRGGRPMPYIPSKKDKELALYSNITYLASREKDEVMMFLDENI